MSWKTSPLQSLNNLSRSDTVPTIRREWMRSAAKRHHSLHNRFLISRNSNSPTQSKNEMGVSLAIMVRTFLFATIKCGSESWMMTGSRWMHLNFDVGIILRTLWTVKLTNEEVMLILRPYLTLGARMCKLKAAHCGRDEVLMVLSRRWKMKWNAGVLGHFLHYEGWIGPGTAWANQAKFLIKLAPEQYRSLDPRLWV